MGQAVEGNNWFNLWYVFGDSTSFAILLGSIADLLPPFAALLSIVWVTIRIYETDTVQRWLKRGKYREND